MLKLVADLVRRPSRGECPKPEKHRNARQGREGLPVICLVSGDGHTQLAEGVRAFLREADPRRVPHCLHRLPSGDAPPSNRESVEAVRGVLEGIAGELARDVNGRDGRVRFRRFGLVNWLMRQGGRAGPEVDGPDRPLLHELRARELSRRRAFGFLRSPESELAVQSRVPWWLWLLATHVIPLAWFRARRGLGREYKWLLNQPYLSPADPGTFEGFAERLTKPHIGGEDAEQLRKLMVNAFLEDLRAAYRRRIWRPRAVRRTAYCVAILDGLGEGNCGTTIIETIIDVRIETGAFDPLLVIAAGAHAPGIGSPAHDDWGDPRMWEPDENLHSGWRHKFEQKGRSRSRSPWYLPVRTPPLLSPEHDDYDYTRRSEISQDSQLRIDDPPRWARRGTLLLLSAVIALVVAMTTGGATAFAWNSGEDYRAAHCGLSRSAPDAETMETASTGECIGVATHGSTFRAPDRALNRTLEVITTLNRRAEQAHRRDPDRPMITLVHLSALLSSAGKSTAQFSYVREALQGAASAQSRQLKNPGRNEPILRIFPANAGSGMRFGTRVAEIVGRMRRRDPSIVGVAGLDQSREATTDTIRRLTGIGLPMVATTLSADALVQKSPLYFQVSPQNRREAEVAAAYADHLVEAGGDAPKREVRVIYSADTTDIYSRNLKDDLAGSFAAHGFRVENVEYSPPQAAGVDPLDAPGPGEVGQQSCSYDGVVFFAGRSEDFESLLGGVNQVCHSSPPVLLGGDDVVRLAADPERRANYPGLSYDFLDFTLGSTKCANVSELYSELRRLFPQECANVASSSLDGHAALAFDAVKLYVNAIKQLREDAPTMPLTPPAVWHAISGVHGDHVLDGESGIISFGGDVERQVPLDKLISVERIDDQGTPRQLGFCGRVGTRRQASWCPRLEAAPS
ncbi:ABC transporter substrate-binding protein [Actinomadura rayongensis]|nr:hypothetical protein [Actinomadura rayongensis]